MSLSKLFNSKLANISEQSQPRECVKAIPVALLFAQKTKVLDAQPIQPISEPHFISSEPTAFSIENLVKPLSPKRVSAVELMSAKPNSPKNKSLSPKKKPVIVEKIVEKIVQVEKVIDNSNEISDKVKSELDQVKELNNKYLNIINQLNDELLIARNAPVPEPAQKALVDNSAELEALSINVLQLTDALNRVSGINKIFARRLGYY